MKRHLLFLSTIATLVFSMTSCLNMDEDSDDYVELTASQKATQLSAVQGNYKGKIYGYNPYLGTLDSLECSMYTANDSILTINIPKKMIASIATSTTNKLVTDDDDTASSVHVLRPYYYDAEKTYAYSIYPKNESFNFDVTINGTPSHMIVYYGTYYQYSAYSYIYPVSRFAPADGHFAAYIPIYGVSVEGGSASASTYLYIDMYRDK